MTQSLIHVNFKSIYNGIMQEFFYHQGLLSVKFLNSIFFSK